VGQVIASLLRAGPPDIRRIADVVGMSTRTLQRRLAGVRIRYRDLLAQVRSDMAMRLLEEPAIRCVDIALDLGYSDHAHFVRAFRAWTGTTPGKFRRLRLRSSPRPVTTRQAPGGVPGDRDGTRERMGGGAAASP